MVITYGPGAAVPAFNVSVEELPAATEVGLKLALAPAGNPVALKATACVNPLVTAVEIVEVPLAPCRTLTLLGLALIEKSFGGVVTVRLTVVECVALAPVPVTVIT
jgi:hypothetical protein